MKLIQLILYLLVLTTGLSQRKEIIIDEFTHFQLTHKKDTIDFIVADTNLSIQKPVLLFCQGSQPIPLFFNLEDYRIVPSILNNFDLDEMKKTYHIVVISMPATPLIVGQDHLNESYNYVIDTSNRHSYLEAFIKADHLENYVVRANAVIQFLQKQKWVKSGQLVVAGHSQGAKVALGVAASNRKVTHLGLFGYNPLGRIDQMIRQARKDAEKGKITWAEADSVQNHYYEFYKEINNEDSLRSNPGLYTWKSFSSPSFNKLLDLEIPVYIGYGSEDVIADFCDFLPLFFIEKHKTNLTMKRYANLEHNFFPVKDGVVNYQDGQWKMVMNAFIHWTL